MPDYQGIGLGVAFLNAIAEIYAGYDFRITTSAKNLIHALNKNNNWRLTDYGRMKTSKGFKESMKKSFRGNVKTASFVYVSK